ncbi:MTP-1 family protein [Paenibacillus thermotolerans]|uniref:MTP-1 family protein n=1 Tax=Paenibacillus thermotolerans TaxID=3027807 RepID=UPI002368E673|nr:MULTISPECIES: DUF1861 family protein [unclassified Paenibacillus]
MVKMQGKAQTCKELLELYVNRGVKPSRPERIMFAGVGDRDVYNITAPFEDEGQKVIAGRVESRDSESSTVVFFVKGADGVWSPREGAPTFDLQDPFFTRIGGDLVLGGVQTFPHPTNPHGLMWRTMFYKGSSIAALRPLFKGPDGMKDLRLVELKDGSIGIFTRPQGEKGGRGKIGYTRIPSLDALSIEAIERAPLLEGQFIDDEWGGANELHLLEDGRVGVLGHIASFDADGGRHYYPMAFLFDPSSESFTPIRLIAQRSDFLPGAAKRPDLEDVVFSGGLVRQPDGTADLYAGISDAEAHRITIPDPFL